MFVCCYVDNPQVGVGEKNTRLGCLDVDVVDNSGCTFWDECDCTWDKRGPADRRLLPRGSTVIVSVSSPITLSKCATWIIHNSKLKSNTRTASRHRQNHSPQCTRPVVLPWLHLHVLKWLALSVPLKLFWCLTSVLERVTFFGRVGTSLCNNLVGPSYHHTIPTLSHAGILILPSFTCICRHTAQSGECVCNSSYHIPVVHVYMWTHTCTSRRLSLSRGGWPFFLLPCWAGGVLFTFSR